MNRPLQLEICVDALDSIRAAERGGADRVELCASLGEGGLTPSSGLIEQAVRATSLPVFVLLRPRVGDFVYDESELEATLADARVARDLGAKGFVVGALRAEGKIHLEFLERVIREADSLPVTFHRAFDFCVSPLDAVMQLRDAGVKRILTSGQAPRVEDGAQLIRELVDAAGERLSIMPGGGLREESLPEVVRITGAREFHTSASVALESTRTSDVALGPAESEARRVTSAERVARFRELLNG